MVNKIVKRTPQGLLMILNAMALVLLFFYKDGVKENSLLFILLFMVAIYGTNILLRKVSTGDNYIFLLVSLLVSIGVFMIYRIDSALGVRQMLYTGAGIIAFFAVYYILKKIKIWDRLIWLYLSVSFVLFVATLIFGTRIGGAKNWIVLGPVNIQPAEIVKILFVFFMAAFYVHRDEIKGKLERNYAHYLKSNKITDNMYTLGFMGICYVFIALLFLQRELGISLLFFAVFTTILFVYEPNRKLILINVAGAVIMAVLGYFLFSHVRVRVDIWRDPWVDFSGRGYQIVQSLFAVAEGGFFGTGIGLGHPEYVPEVHTDFIFAAICEEMGLFAGIAVMLMFLIIVYRGIKISLNQKNQFFKIVALGVTATFGYQAFIILGGVINMIPLTGITLPFMSYGGSSLVSGFISLGILQFASEEIDMEREIKDEQ